jgi:hypothetical protein
VRPFGWQPRVSAGREGPLQVALSSDKISLDAADARDGAARSGEPSDMVARFGAGERTRGTDEQMGVGTGWLWPRIRCTCGSTLTMTLPIAKPQAVEMRIGLDSMSRCARWPG